MSNITTNIRMYKLEELGDCFLVTFSDDSKDYNVMIDCGSYWNRNDSPKKFKRIVKNIQETIGNNASLDLVVATHQHNDHMSGFMHAKNAFTSLGMEQVVLSWLDDETDPEAIAIAEEHGKVMNKLRHIKGIIDKKKGGFAETVKSSLSQLVDERTFKTDNSLTGQATQFLKSVGKQPIKYLSPGDILDLPGYDKDKVRIHVLGPPKDSKSLKSKNPRKKESFHTRLHDLSIAIDDIKEVLDTGHADKHFPFNKKYRQYPHKKDKNDKVFSHQSTKTIFKEYIDKKYDWKRIDHDWLSSVNRFALHLNGYTNNTSLVLAFELVQSGKILLFVGDAQAGNWRSWETVPWKDDNKKMNLEEMMGKTVFYKVGHHGSHNATIKPTLDLMTHKDLVAFIPVDKRDPNISSRKIPWKMPAKNLYKELKKKTKGRIARMDEGKIKYSSNNWPRGSVKEHELYVEYKIKE
ncbi:MBL fold metallo-hydrolase [uncultured Psychroserpens sp.]|uniref:MBL fold metallo-hydrolase n=1 Tax=uncultured Psychroserpens sp. TaxID=255436 RepID=UPI00261E651C|nr:MBL fold metallo-hydrolase [uncultured Psychroserpens sp.]